MLCVCVMIGVIAGDTRDAEDQQFAERGTVGREETAQGTGAAESEGALGLPTGGDGLACGRLCSGAQVEEGCCQKGNQLTKTNQVAEAETTRLSCTHAL